MKDYRYIFADMDDTLIRTRSGDTFPRGVWDMELRIDVLERIKKLKPKKLFIVTNQGGLGEYVNEDYFRKKLEYVAAACADYIGCEAWAVYCGSKDKADPWRKPNTGMAEHCISHYIPYKEVEDPGFKSRCLMIGDASGKPGDFSDSDRKFAENLGIDYWDVEISLLRSYR